MNQEEQFSSIFDKYGYCNESLDLSKDIEILTPLILNSVLREGLPCKDVAEMLFAMMQVDRQIFTGRLLQEDSIVETLKEAHESYNSVVDDGYLVIEKSLPPTLCRLWDKSFVDVSESAAEKLIAAGYGINELRILISDKIRIVSCKGYSDGSFYHPNVTFSRKLCLADDIHFDLNGIHEVVRAAQYFNLTDTFFRPQHINEITNIVTHKEESNI